MKNLNNFSIFLLLLFIIAGCSSVNTGEQLYIEKGNYKFTIYDKTGDSIASGNFNIISIQGNDMSGTYIFDKMYKPNPVIKPNETHDMTGTLTDDRKQIFINANPKLADNNIFITLTAGLYSYMGEWRYSTYVGTVDQGTIRAYRM